MSVVDLPAVPRVLIAEADLWSRDLLKQAVLNVCGDAQLVLCVDGQQALEHINESLFDLVIADWELPGIDGLGLLRRIRQQRREPAQPFILLSSRKDTGSVREAIPLAPTEYMTKPVNMDSLAQRLRALLSAGEQDGAGVAPSKAPDMTLSSFLEHRRNHADGAPLMIDILQAVKSSFNPGGLDLALLEQNIRTDPQAMAVLIAAANSAAQQRGASVQTLAMALRQLGPVQSMNLLQSQALKRGARLTDSVLEGYAQRQWAVSLETAGYAAALARLLGLDAERCYCAGLLHRLGDLTLLRCLQEWQRAGGELSDEMITQSLRNFAAAFGSALRTRWRLPLELRELIATVYHLDGGVYSREALALNLAAQLAQLDPAEGLEELAKGKTARLLQIGLAQLMRLREGQQG